MDAAGSSSLRTTSRRPAPMMLNIWISSGSTLRMPSNVVLSRMKNTVMATSTTFDSIPVPKKITNSGASAILGMA